MEIYIQPNVWADSYEIYILEQNYNGKRFIVKPMLLELKEHKEGESEEPSIKISRMFGKSTGFLQALSDALAKVGYEPKTVEENKGELKATKYHLEDLRQIIFKPKES